MTVICSRCKTKLNLTDLNCWRCGGLDLEPVFVIADFESVPEEEPKQ